MVLNSRLWDVVEAGLNEAAVSQQFYGVWTAAMVYLQRLSCAQSCF